MNLLRREEMALWLTAAVMAGVLAACAIPAKSGKDPFPPVITDADAYAVYGAVISLEPAERRRSLIVAADTHRLVGMQCLPKADTASNPWSEVVEDFAAKNQSDTGRRLAARIPLPPSSYTLLSFDHMRRRATQIGRPVGYIAFSRVGFDAMKTRAIVHREHGCMGGFCGDGADLFLEKRDGEWRVITPAGVTGCGWIS